MQQDREHRGSGVALLVAGLAGLMLLALVVFGYVHRWTQQPSFAPSPSPSPTPAATRLMPKIMVRSGFYSTYSGPSIPMLLVPAGEFIMGSESGDFNERPVHTVYLDAFYIDQYEVANWMYEICVREGVCRAPERIGETFSSSKTYGKPEYADYPVDMINWHMAKTYCEWRGARLPSEAEWEKAARSTDGRSYPWGEGIDCLHANYVGCVGGPVAVGSYEEGKSIYGAYNMAGNVWEWVSSVYQIYPFDPDFNLYITEYENRVARGGSWADLPESLRTANRTWLHPWLTYYFDTVGFRCALTAR